METSMCACMHIWTRTALKSSLLASALHPQQPRESYTLRYATRLYRLECRVSSRTCSDSAARKCLRHWQDHLNVVRLGRHLRESVEGVGGVAGSSRSSIGQCLYIPARLGAHGVFVGSTESWAVRHPAANGKFCSRKYTIGCAIK